MTEKAEFLDLSGGNFTMVNNLIMRSEKIPVHEKMVYFVLKSYANSQTGEAFPGMKRVARESGISERKARDCMRNLEKLGLIKTEFRDRQTNLYTFLPVRVGLLNPAQDAGPPGTGCRTPRHDMPPNNINSNKIKNNKEHDVVFQRLYDRYQSKKIIQHHKPTEAMKRAVNARLKDFTEEQLVQVIDNYATVVLGDDYWFTHKYGFGDLMREKDVLKFVDAADPLNNFRKQSFGQTVQTVPQPKRITDYESLYTAGED